MAALDGQEEVVPPLDAQAGKGSRPLSQVGLDDISRAGVLDQAVDLAEAAAHAKVFQRVDAPDGSTVSIATGCAAQSYLPLARKAVWTVGGNRLPLAYHSREDLSRGRIGCLSGSQGKGFARLGGGRQGVASLDG